MAGEIGLPSEPLGLYGEQWKLEERTTDPASTSKGEAWLRTDLAPKTDQLATLRFDNGSGTWDIPIFQTGTSSGGVEEVLRIPVGGTTGYIPILDGSPTFPQLGFQHASTRYGLHDDTVAFTPDDIASLAHWYDANEISGSDGASVSTWSDKKGTNDVSQGTGSKQPTLKVNIINGNQAVRFDNTDDVLRSTGMDAITQPFTVYGLFQMAGVGDSNVLTQGRATGGAAGFVNPNSSGSWRIFSGSGLSGGTSDTNVTVMTCRFDGASSYIRINGTQVASGDAGSRDPDQGTTTIGNNDGESQPFNGDVVDVLWYSDTQNSSQESQIEQYLADKGGITL